MSYFTRRSVEPRLGRGWARSGEADGQDEVPEPQIEYSAAGPMHEVPQQDDGQDRDDHPEEEHDDTGDSVPGYSSRSGHATIGTRCRGTYAVWRPETGSRARPGCERSAAGAGRRRTGGRGTKPLVGLAVRLRALGAEVRVCAPPDWAERPADLSEGGQRERRTCRTRGSALREAPVIRPVGAGRRSMAALEVSR